MDKHTTEDHKSGEVHPECYEIRVGGHLSQRFSDWFNGMSITNLENGETVLRGAVVDQAALHGLLNRIRDLNLKLISVKRS